MSAINNLNLQIMRASNKKLIPKHIRNKYAKEMRKLLKNKRAKGINANMICLS